MSARVMDLRCRLARMPFDYRTGSALKGDCMRYLMLVIENPEDRRNRPTESGREKFDQMMRFSEGLKARGVLQATESLKTEGVRVEVRGGKRIVVDGPFAEAKEM